MPTSFPTTSYISASRVARHQKSLGEWLIAPTIPSSPPLSISLVISIISDNKKNNNNSIIEKLLWNIRNKVWEISGTSKKWGRWPWATKNVSPLTATALEPLSKVKTVENHLIPISYIQLQLSLSSELFPNCLIHSAFWLLPLSIVKTVENHLIPISKSHICKPCFQRKGPLLPIGQKHSWPHRVWQNYFLSRLWNKMNSRRSRWL